MNRPCPGKSEVERLFREHEMREKEKKRPPRPPMQFELDYSTVMEQLGRFLYEGFDATHFFTSAAGGFRMAVRIEPYVETVGCNKHGEQPLVTPSDFDRIALGVEPGCQYCARCLEERLAALQR